MADLSKIRLNGNDYNFKDAAARTFINNISDDYLSLTNGGIVTGQSTFEGEVNLDYFTSYHDSGDGSYIIRQGWNDETPLNVGFWDSTFYGLEVLQSSSESGASVGLTGLRDPNEDYDATNKKYVDDLINKRYGVCSTAASTAAKTVTIDGINDLFEGLFIFVKFANSNSKANPTLQVNDLDAAAIKRYGTTAPSTSAASSWNAGSVILLIYDGTYWQQADWINTTYSSMTAAEITAGTGTSARNITPANLKTAIETWSPVKSVNGNTGTVTVSQLQTTAGADNTEYNLIGTATSNTNNALVDIYQPTLISFSKYDSNFARLTLGSTTTPGEIRIYTSASGASGYTDLKSAASGTNTRTITLPDATGTVALTSDIPDVKSWALAATKPSYTFTELTSHPTSISGYGITDAYTKTEVDGMVSGVFHYKGTKATVSALPSSGNTTGDVWHVTADNGEYAWDGITWQELGSNIDLSGYVPTSTKVNGKALTGDISLTASDVSALPSNTTYVSSFNGSTGAITYTAPVTSVNGQTGVVTITEDDQTWNGVSLAKQQTTNTGDSTYVPLAVSTSPINMSFTPVKKTPTANAIAKYDSNAYLYSTTPSANDNSTKVATTAYVDGAGFLTSAIYMLEYGSAVNFDNVLTAFNSGKIIIAHYDYDDLEIYGTLTHIMSDGETNILKFLTNDNQSISGNVYNITWIWSIENQSDNGWGREEIFLAKSSHTHGFLNSNGTFSSQVPIASGDFLTVADYSNNQQIAKTTLAFGSSTTQYLANNGTWQNIPTRYNASNNTTGYLTMADLPVYDGGVS